MNWKENINTIKEIHQGQFQIILDFATTKILPYVLSNDYNYVWVNGHTTHNPLEWKEYELPLFNNQHLQKVLARNISFDYVVPTSQFKELLPQLPSGIHLVQMNMLPPYYLNLSSLKGKTRYELLTKECDYLFEIEIPSATDYGSIVSSNKGYLESLLGSPDIDWNNLP